MVMVTELSVSSPDIVLLLSSNLKDDGELKIKKDRIENVIIMLFILYKIRLSYF